MPRRIRLWRLLLVLPLPLTAQEAPGPADTSSPAVPGVVEERAARGYDLSPHGIQGLEIGHLNRVDGWTPGLGLTLLSVRPNALPTLDLSAGVRTSRLDQPWFRFEATQLFPALDRLQLSAQAYRSTHTPDDWKVAARENDIWLFVFRTDLRNYYEANGARLAVATSDLRPWGLALALQSEQNHPLQEDRFFTLSTIFGDDEDFRRNPAAAAARLTSAFAEARLVTASTQSPSLRVPGWNLSAGLERAGDFLGGERSFWRGTLHLRRYTRLSERHWVNARLYLSGPVLGTGGLPPQRFTYLGGPGSLPGFSPLALGGDRGVLGSVEYTYQLPNTSWSTPVFLLWQLEIFSNLGNAVRLANHSRLYSDLHWDAGAGVSGITVLGYLGIFFAQRLSHFDEPSAGPRVFFRLQRTF